MPQNLSRLQSEEEKKNKNKPRDSTATGQSYPTDGGDTDEDLSDLPRVTLEEFLAIIAMDENARSFAALVNTQILYGLMYGLTDNSRYRISAGSRRVKRQARERVTGPVGINKSTRISITS
ncbi:hypothetical protein B0H13DRAFT_1903690 [Mycena leptocephala]|nr:hypothetical protein B0H13DRAFT_1903690 [Mycena leptocephala]